jgi:large subunit ribosomal protein L21
MFAVIRTGGKQYRVAKDDVIVVEKLAGDPGATVAFTDVLMMGEGGKAPSIGTPRLDKAAVYAEVVEQGRDDKIIVFKKRRRKKYRRTRGHRQERTVLRITDISASGRKPTAKAAQKAKAPAAKKPKAPAKPKAAAKAKTPAKTKTPAKPKE